MFFTGEDRSTKKINRSKQAFTGIFGVDRKRLLNESSWLKLIFYLLLQDFTNLFCIPVKLVALIQQGYIYTSDTNYRI